MLSWSCGSSGFVARDLVRATLRWYQSTFRENWLRSVVLVPFGRMPFPRVFHPFPLVVVDVDPIDMVTNIVRRCVGVNCFSWRSFRWNPCAFVAADRSRAFPSPPRHWGRCAVPALRNHRSHRSSACGIRGESFCGFDVEFVVKELEPLVADQGGWAQVALDTEDGPVGSLAS